MADDFIQQRTQLQTAFSLPDFTTIVQALKEQELTTPPVVLKGSLRVRLNLEAEVTAPLEDYLSCATAAHAFTMFTVPSLTDKQVLTWLQAEPLSVLRSLWQHLDVFGRWGGQLKGEFPQVQAELFAAAGILTWQGGPLEEYLAGGQPGMLAEHLSKYAYVDQLAQTYAAAGIQVSRELRGLRMPTLVPPSLLVAVLVLEAQLARDNGAESISVAYNPCGHILQDVAAMGALANLTRHLRAAIVCLPWAGGSLLGVQNTSTAAAWTALTSSLGSARHAEVVTVDKDQSLEPEQVMRLLELARGVTGLAVDQKTAIAAAASQEQQFIQQEASSIVDRVLELGEGQVAMGLERAFAEGSLDIPLAAAGLCRGQVLSARDATGAVRFLDSGALPLPEENREWHREQLAERADAEGRQPGVPMAIDDIYAFSKGTLIGRK